MRLLSLLAILAPITAEAKDLLCTPDKVCVPGNCDIPINEEASFRMRHPDSIAPSLRSHGETIAMAKTFQHQGQSLWTGLNAVGEHEGVWLDREWMNFEYTIGGPYVKYVGREVRYRAIGKCEVQ